MTRLLPNMTKYIRADSLGRFPIIQPVDSHFEHLISLHMSCHKLTSIISRSGAPSENVEVNQAQTGASELTAPGAWELNGSHVPCAFMKNFNQGWRNPRQPHVPVGVDQILVRHTGEDLRFQWSCVVDVLDASDIHATYLVLRA